MRLGIFDSGFGGLLIAQALHDFFPDLDKVYLGDTLNLPYGSRSEETIYQVSRSCIDTLFMMDCQLIIVACNTVSASALRRLQQEYLTEHYPDRRILGVVVPTIEEALERGSKRLGVIGTNYTIHSNIYSDELKKINSNIEIVSKRTPLLVPLIENDGEAYLDDVINDYLSFMKNKAFDALLLGCTHYVHLKNRIRRQYDFDVISQDEIIPKKLNEYFKNHPEHYDLIGNSGEIEIYMTDITDDYERNAMRLFGDSVSIRILEGVHD